MELEREYLMETFQKYEGIINSISRRKVLKNSETFKVSKDTGNALYSRKAHDEVTHAQIFACYNRAVANATNQSELSLAYGNRSAFLLHIKRYKASIIDIDRALSLTNSVHLKIKLLCRKVQCLKALGNDSFPKSLMMAENFLEEVDEKDSYKKSLAQLVLQTQDLKIYVSGFNEVLVDFSSHAHLAIRLLIMAVKESGNLENLKIVLKAIDDIKDTRHKGFFHDQQPTVNTFRAIYTLKSEMSNKSNLQQMSIYACRCLLVLAKFSSFFGRDEKFDCVQDLLQNDTAIFVGSLILKLLKITMFNGHVYRGIDYPVHEQSETHEDFDSKLGRSVAPLYNLINHSCYPNARRIFTRDWKIIVLCVLPIKKNDQIFETYKGCFYEESKSDRLKTMREYEFVCHCRACRENWPTMLEMARKEGDVTFRTAAEHRCDVTCLTIGESLREKCFELNEETVDYLSEYITKESAKGVPNSITCYAIFTFREMFRAFYSFRRESFGNCH
ncbi:hypothetical protein QAD02_015862 [Eretmocerus hayati]|uniref:Uncharacterized protein n=1 Tax=Eretmocerus hayati TaxID=131215 RepID=A0ACC2P9I5_9HYME|nr:hypothetical protein QAD02_015862 [Eretmocerus hayati]